MALSTIQNSNTAFVREDAVDDIFFPTKNSIARAEFTTSDGKNVTKHRWDVYDYIMRVPKGKITTYKLIAEALGSGSPRSVGSALRNNPFAPLVPCHRVVASNFFIGGFCGEWGQNPNKGDQESLFDKKKRMLAEEGVFFDDKGYLKKGQDVIWKGP